MIEFFEDGRLELYNLRDDIGERKNLVRREPGKATKLHAKWKRWRQMTGAKMPPLNPAYDPEHANPGASRRGTGNGADIDYSTPPSPSTMSFARSAISRQPGFSGV